MSVSIRLSKHLTGKTEGDRRTPPIVQSQKSPQDLSLSSISDLTKPDLWCLSPLGADDPKLYGIYGGILRNKKPDFMRHRELEMF